MASDASDEDKKGPAEIVPFPFSRVAPARNVGAAPGDVAYGRLVAEIGLPIEQTTGHWCSFCQKIWFGYLLEVACPTCGGRHG